MKAITTTVYQANDGSIWPTETEGAAHEAELIVEEKNTYYARVVSGPDLTEDRGFSRLVYLRVKGLEAKYLKHLPEELVLDWCHRTYGRPIGFVMGVQATTSWFAQPSDRASWIYAGKEHHTDRDYVSCGNIKSYATQVTLVMGEKEQGLIVDLTEEDIVKPFI